MEKKNEKDWNKSPIVILISVIAAIIPIIIFITGKPTLPEIMATSTSTAVSQSFELQGVWEGTDSRGILFRITFGSECNMNEVCGKVELPTVGCTAFPVLISSSSDTFVFKETSHQNCLPATGNDTIKLLEDGTLLYGSNGQSPTVILYQK